MKIYGDNFTSSYQLINWSAKLIPTSRVNIRPSQNYPRTSIIHKIKEFYKFHFLDSNSSIPVCLLYYFYKSSLFRQSFADDCWDWKIELWILPSFSLGPWAMWPGADLFFPWGPDSNCSSGPCLGATWPVQQVRLFRVLKRPLSWKSWGWERKEAKLVKNDTESVWMVSRLHWG